mmetsp:Transcript_52746/g.83729  ORF Transcript_52746/g.83729 Transcript_52746/m.83729 type:complete len:229 (+) Transcript_52746:77-763(+)
MWTSAFAALLFSRLSECTDDSTQINALISKDSAAGDARGDIALLSVAARDHRLDQIRRSFTLVAAGVANLINSSYHNSNDAAGERDRLASDQRIRACLLKAMSKDPIPAIAEFRNELTALKTNPAAREEAMNKVANSAAKEKALCDAIVGAITILKNDYTDLGKVTDNPDPHDTTAEQRRILRWKLVGYLYKAAEKKREAETPSHSPSHSGTRIEDEEVTNGLQTVSH